MSDFIARRLRAFARFVVVTAALATPAAAMILPYPSSKNRQGPGSTPPPSPSPAPAPPPHAPAPAHPPADALLTFPGGYIATINGGKSVAQFTMGWTYTVRGRGLADFAEGWVLQEHLRFDPAQGRIDETRGSYLRIDSATDETLIFSVTTTRGGKAPWPRGFGEKRGVKLLLAKRSGQRFSIDFPEAIFWCQDGSPNCKNYGVPEGSGYKVRGCYFHRSSDAGDHPYRAYVDTVARWPSDANHSMEFTLKRASLGDWDDRIVAARCDWDAKGRCEANLYEHPNFQGRSVTIYGAQGLTHLNTFSLNWLKVSSFTVFCTQ